MADAATGPDESDGGDFPAVPDFAPLAGKGEPSRAVDRCLGMLDRQSVRSFGSEAMVLTALSVADLQADLPPLCLAEEIPLLERFDATLAGFTTGEDAGRRRRTTVEWLKGLDAPIGDFLDRLEALVREVPDVTGRRPAEWDTIASIYERALDGITELADFVRAGQIRMGELTQRMESARPGPGGEELSDQLRRKRNELERRTHLLRIVRARVADYLTEVRKVAAARNAFGAQLHALATRAMPEWEAVLLSVAEAAQNTGQGRAPVELDPVLEANAKLRVAVRTALEAGAALREAGTAASGSDPGEIQAIERRIMGAGEQSP